MNGNEQTDHNEKYIKMTTQPVERLICRLAVPTVISMLVTSFYNMADTFYVGRIGADATTATGAVGVAFSFMAILQACGFFFGQGSGNYISRQLGAQNRKAAEEMASTALLLSMLFGLVIMAFTLLWLKGICRILGATETILPFARDYIRIIVMGAPFVTGSMTLNNQLRFQGSAQYAMLGIVSGAVLNIGFNQLCVIELGLGIKGAAYATVAGQVISFFVLLAGTFRRGNLRINPAKFRLNGTVIKEIFKGGTPSLARQGLSSVSTICLNRMANPYGDAAIAAMSIVTRVIMFIASSLIGFGQGYQPVCGFNYGARRFDRVKKGYLFCVKTATALLVVLAALGIVFAPSVVEIFRKGDTEVTAIGAMALRLQCASLPLAPLVVISNMMLQNIGKVFKASFVAMLRQGLLFIPAVLILPAFFGLTGLACAQTVSDVLAFFITLPIIVGVLRELDRQTETALPKRNVNL